MKNPYAFVILVVAILFQISGYSQDLSAYIDYMDRFYVFDSGESKKIEDLRPQSFKVGGECILYVDNAGHLKMYKNGAVKKLEQGGVNENNYFATDHLAGYNVFEKLKVVHKGQAEELSNRCSIYKAEDSLIAFYDNNLESLRVFYKGVVLDIESGILGNSIQNWSSGDNMVAYISDRTKDFKIWYQGETNTIKKNVANTRFKVGLDIVAYIDPIDESFIAYYKGEEFVLSDFPPESYKVADECVAFVDNMGEFKYFSNKKVSTISTVTPETYILEDYSLVYAEDGRFKAWYNGRAIEVEAWIPSVYKLDWNTLAYIDNTQRIWIFQNGERKYLSNEFVTGFDIYRDLIQMGVKVDRNIIYYKNQFYEGESYYK